MRLGALARFLQVAAFDAPGELEPGVDCLAGPYPYASEHPNQEEHEDAYHEDGRVGTLTVDAGVAKGRPARPRVQLIDEASDDDGRWKDVDGDKHANSYHELLEDNRLLLLASVAKKGTDAQHADKPDNEEGDPDHEDDEERQNQTEEERQEGRPGCVLH